MRVVYKTLFLTKSRVLTAGYPQLSQSGSRGAQND
jgi:hypothetical protein